jgi:hypothetical protein
MRKLPNIQPRPRCKRMPGSTLDIARCVLEVMDPDAKAEVIAPAIADYWLELTAAFWHDEQDKYYLDTFRDARLKRHPAGIATRDRATAKRWFIKALLLGCGVTCASDADRDNPPTVGLADWRDSRRQQNEWNRQREEACKRGTQGEGSFHKRLAADMAKAAAYRKQFEKAPLTKKQKEQVLSGAGTKWYCSIYKVRDPAFIKELGDEPFALIRLLTCDCEGCICKLDDTGITAREYDQYLRQHRPTAEEAALLEVR